MRYGSSSRLNVSSDQAGLVLSGNHRIVRDLFVNFRQWFVDRLNEELGIAGNDIELDEVSFRSKDLDDKAFWLELRFIWVWELGSQLSLDD